MTRFEATDPRERRKLFADAITAHRNRASPYVTIEVDPLTDADGEPLPAPWVQFSEKTFNLDCTDCELDLLKTVLEEYPEFRIDGLETPENAEGTNVRVSARSDANRLAAFVDHVFQQVYGRDEDYRAWVVEL